MSTRLRIDLSEYVEHFRARVLLDALAEATATYWRRRADALDEAKHDPGTDYRGRADLDDLRRRWVELDAASRACRNRAEISLIPSSAERGCCVLSAGDRARLEEVWAMLAEAERRAV